jgi:DNA-directed RNA polymerase specialized sigma24 family protein
MAILKNVLRETGRRKYRAMKEVEQLDATEPELGMKALQALPTNVAVERAEFWEIVEGGLELPPVKTARIFWEREVERKPVHEVAAEMGVSDNVVTVSLHRARKFVRNWVTRTMKFVGLGFQK